METSVEHWLNNRDGGPSGNFFQCQPNILIKAIFQLSHRCWPNDDPLNEVIETKSSRATMTESTTTLRGPWGSFLTGVIELLRVWIGPSRLINWNPTVNKCQWQKGKRALTALKVLSQGSLAAWTEPRTRTHTHIKTHTHMIRAISQREVLHWRTSPRFDVWLSIFFRIRDINPSNWSL